MRPLASGLLLLGLALGLALPTAQAEVITYTGAQARTAGQTVLHQTASDWQAGTLNSLRPEGDALVTEGERGMYTSPEIPLAPFDELVPSWNVQTGKGGYAVLKVRARLASGWTDWYSFGRWSRSGDRYSLKAQKDAHGEVLTDVLRLKGKATAVQYHLSLVGEGTRARLVALNTTDRAQRPRLGQQAGNPALWNRVIDVPQRSQMLYPDGGEVWCSPTSVSMILAYLGTSISVPEAAKGTYDRVYDGTGNWAFNAAYAGELGYRAYITRLPSLAAAEEFIARGQPLAVSLGWGRGELSGAPIPTSSGHLMVLVGFDAQGNPVLNDPAAPSNAAVRRSYPRAQFERLWLGHSGGLSYVIEKRG
ncbi:peptidase C39 family protein [Deinococcus sp. Marseille-Q6407]|uniref:peptidase C39 family protein n=1 Tax=Deinococcus sp. Marseille-Q6407 TaxID=2969223 RepID=UPI0021C2395A|nr:peptidase C39 family protein [Deinococcus sp. Marseille-Q6407]